jgi:hypothetical protein
MREKLKKFSDFAAKLLPHETEYLMAVQRFEDAERANILRIADLNAKNLQNSVIFSEEIDKRKYSHLKNWIEERLSTIDVDEQFNRMSAWENGIAKDNISPTSEKELIKAIHETQATDFYFVKFYELVRQYRQFLLIRIRYKDYQLANEFVLKYEKQYNYAKSVDEKLHTATVDIVKQYAQNDGESILWESWLSEVFYDEQLDGQNRYFALVRLIFISFNYKHFQTLKQKFDALDKLFKEGRYYSKRILLNYYANLLLLYANFRDYEKAEYFGYLSIREKNHDYLYYVNNLSALLLRQRKYEQALQLLKPALADMKTTQNLHSKVGYVAHYVRALNGKGLFRNAQNFAESFLIAYRKEVLEHRWHLFFTAYIENLLHQRKYDRILKIVRKDKLLERDKKYQNRPNYLPSLVWYHAIADYHEQGADPQRLVRQFTAFAKSASQDTEHEFLLNDLLALIKEHLPEIFQKIQSALKKS